jgi:hypothetical protein
MLFDVGLNEACLQLILDVTLNFTHRWSQWFVHVWRESY